MSDSSKDPKDYYIRVDDKYKCKLCDYSGAQSNVIRHLHAKHPEISVTKISYNKEKMVKEDSSKPSMFVHHTKSGNEVPISQYLIDVLHWKTKHNISMEAINDKLFKQKIAARPDDLLSDNEMRIRINEISQQLIDKTHEVMQNEIMSIVIDGGTINSYSYYALGGVYWDPVISKLNTRLLDVIICKQTSTTQNILNMLSDTITSIDKGHLVIVAVCCDNAKNISVGFINTHMLSNSPRSSPNYTPLPILRIACAIHTLNLIIGDLINEQESFVVIYNELKRISKAVKTMSRKTKFEKKILGFPKIQKQRWNSLYLVFSYLHVHYNDVKEAFPDFAVAYDTIEKFKCLLEPHAQAIVQLESDTASQVTVYRECIRLKNEWLSILNKKGYPEAEFLIERYNYHTLYTMDIRISMLAYYLTKGGVNEWKTKYPIIRASTMMNEEQKMIQKETRANLLILRETADTLSSIWGIKSISPIMEHYLYNVSFKTSHYDLPTEDELLKSELNSFSPEYCSMFIDFIQRIRVLPASEAHSERIFASMRDLVSDNQKSMTAENIRSEAILKLSRIIRPQRPLEKKSSQTTVQTRFVFSLISDSSSDEDIFDQL